MISQAKFNICKKKSFLISKPKDCPYYLEYKDKIEETHGMNLGAGMTRQVLSLTSSLTSSATRTTFVEKEPLGSGQLITVEDLGFSHDLFEQDAGLYEVLFHKYANATKWGVLILVGSLDNFKKWTASAACRKEVEHIPDGRLFAYIEHSSEDNPTDLGYIVHLDAENCDASATVEDGIGYIFWNDGQFYHGELRDGIRSGLGTEGYLDGPSTTTTASHSSTTASATISATASATISTTISTTNTNTSASTIASTANTNTSAIHIKTKDHTTLHYCYYDGEWENGMYHGKGKKTYANRDVYTGTFHKDQMHGKGIFTFANGDVLESEWVYGE